MSHNSVSSPGSIRSLTKAVILLASFTALVCTQACRENKLTVPPFTIDSLMTYSAEGLLTLVDASVLKDSVAPNKQGVRTWYTVLMPGTATEARISWKDSTRLQMWEVTVRAKQGQPNLWMSRDSIRTGLSVSDVQRINGYPFMVYTDGSASGWSSVGRGVLTEHIASVSFDNESPLATLFCMSSTDSALLVLNLHVQSFSITRWVLPSQITVVRKPIIDPKRNVTNYVPQVVNRYGSPIDVGAINDEILKRFGLKSYDSIAPNFSWSNVAFTWEADNGYLALDISGTHHGAHPSDVHETLYFRTQGGMTQMIDKVPFIAFLNYDQFFPFFKKYWLAECLAKRAKADKCAGTEATCDCYDNINVSVAGDKVSLSLESEACFPHVTMACAPKHTVSLSWDEVQPFLNDFGKKYLRQYAGPGLLDKMDISRIYNSDAQPSMLFLKLKNENPVGFEELPDTFFGLQFNHDGTVSGYTDEDEFQGRRPEYLGDPQGPTRVTGTYDAKRFEITIPSEEEEPGTLSFTWGQTSEEMKRRTFHVDAPVGRITFIRHTHSWWVIGVLQSEVEEYYQYSHGSSQELELPDNPTTVICTYQGPEEGGDCYHILFSCGDFVAAETQLSEAEQALWNDLENYTGRSFEITYSKTEGWPCQAGYPDTSEMTRGDVPLITGFKLQDN